MIPKLRAICLVLLALSPLTAPFGSCDVSTLFRASVHLTGSQAHARRLGRVGSKTANDTELSVHLLASDGREEAKRFTLSGSGASSDALRATLVPSVRSIASAQPRANGRVPLRL